MKAQNPTTTVELAPSQITIGGTPLSSPSSVLRGFRAQRDELGNQLDNLQDMRQNLARELLEVPAGGAGRTGIEQRIAGIDARIANLDKAIADADAQVAKAAAIKAQRAAIEHTLREMHWNRRKAAVSLGVSYKTLLNKIKECGIRRA